MSKQVNLQDVFLNQIRKDKIPAIIYLSSGFKVKGYIKGFDNFIIIVESDDKQQMVYKHAISTILPSKRITTLFNDKNLTE